MGGRNRLRFCLRVEHDMVLAWASKLTWFSMGGRKTDFRVGDRKSSDFSVGIGIDLASVWTVEIYFVFVSGHRN